MGHAVHYRDASGEQRFEDVTSLEAALELVERLRNEDNASDVRVYREVPIEVRTYYKVVVADDGAPAAAADVAEVAAPEVAAPQTVAAEVPVGVPTEPPAGAMPLVPPHPRMESPDADPVPAPASEQRRPLFNRN